MSYHAEIASKIVENCIAKKSHKPFLNFVHTCQDTDVGTGVMLAIAKNHLDQTQTRENSNNNISTRNHSIAGEIMMVCGALLESGAPGAEEIAPIFLRRLETTLNAFVSPKSADDRDAEVAVPNMTLPIIAAFSVSAEVRRAAPAQKSLIDLLDRLILVSNNNNNNNNNTIDDSNSNSSSRPEIDEEISENLRLLRRMLNIQEGEEIIVIEPSTGVGCIVELSGISQVVQIEYFLSAMFPKDGDDNELNPTKKPKRKCDSNSWTCWNGRAGVNLDQNTLASFNSLPHVRRCMISHEASVDEIPFVTLQNNGNNKNTSKSRVILLAPPLSHHSIDPEGVFHQMEPEVTTIRKLNAQEVQNWLRSCVHLAVVENPMNEEEKLEYPLDKPYSSPVLKKKNVQAVSAKMKQKKAKTDRKVNPKK